MNKLEIIESIKRTIAQSGRLREASLHKKFSLQERELIECWQSNESFKIKALRTAGFGQCKCCGTPTKYAEKLRFYEYCSSTCEVQHRRNNKLNSLKEELVKLGLFTNSTNYETIDTELTLSCVNGHVFNSTMRHIRYRKIGCTICQCDTKLNNSNTKRRLIAEKKKQEASDRLLVKKKNTFDRLMSKVGTQTQVKCKACGEFTKFKLVQNKLYSPKFCGEDCKKLHREQKVQTHFEELKSMLDPKLHEHAGLISTNRHDTHHLIRFNECGHEYPVIFRNIVRPHHGTYSTGKCPDCNRWSSATAEKIISAVQEAGFSVEVNNRKILAGQEIDIFVPERRLGIEVDGIWWHSSFYKPSDYHLKKTQAARDAGVTLLHFFSDEIDNQFEVVKSMILQKLGISDRVQARRCTVDYVKPKVGRKFLDDHHLQRACTAKHYVGLFHVGELISLMSFRKPFVKSPHQWEIARLCTKTGVTVIGGASKMLSFFERRHVGSIVTFSDERYTTGKVYEQLNFKLSHVTKPGYSYVVNGKREHRLKYQKHLLKKRGIEAEGKTEEQIMSELRIPRIYDCGHKLWVKTSR
jgi:very-short-patch-repair endonuclease